MHVRSKSTSLSLFDPLLSHIYTLSPVVTLKFCTVDTAVKALEYPLLPSNSRNNGTCTNIQSCTITLYLLNSTLQCRFTIEHIVQQNQPGDVCLLHVTKAKKKAWLAGQEQQFTKTYMSFSLLFFSPLLPF